MVRESFEVCSASDFMSDGRGDIPDLVAEGVESCDSAAPDRSAHAGNANSRGEQVAKIESIEVP